MSEKTNNSLILAILGGSFMIAAAIIFYAVINSPNNLARVDSAPYQEPNSIIENINLDDDPVLGDENAPVTLVEFSDYQCGYCRRHFQETLPKLYENYIKTGKVKMVFRDAANLGQKSIELANAASCAQYLKDDQTYYKIHNAIYSGIKSNDDLTAIAVDSGIDKNEYLSCLQNMDMQEEVINDTEESRAYGVSGTPTFFINGEKLVGAQPYEVIAEVIESKLK